MGQRTILVIEDDGAIRRGVVDSLRFHGYEALEAGNGRTGLELALSASYDLVLLDVVLPERDGFSILKELRTERPTTPVILLTAKGDENDRVQGLRLGADDYVVKPFSVRELIARVEAVMRRSPERPQTVGSLELAAGTVDLERCEIRYRDGVRETLSEREVELLRYLASHPSRVVTREEILTRVWRINARGVETRTIDMHVARLREKLRDSDPPQVLTTVRGKGYMFTPTAEVAASEGRGGRK